MLLPIATFDILPPEYSTDLVFNFTETEELPEDTFPEYLALGYETYISIPNLGSIFWFTTYFTLVGLASVLARFCL